MNRKTTKNILLLLGLVCFLLFAANAFAGAITKPNTFTDGTPALADEVNANFDTVYDEVNRVGAVMEVYSSRVGIGTSTPSAKLQIFDGRIKVSGSDPVLLMEPGNGNTATIAAAATGEHLDIEGTESISLKTANGGSWPTAIEITSTGNVGIGTIAPAAALEVNGYSKLGSDSPSIKMKKFVGTTALSQGGVVQFSHGLDPTKILSYTLTIFYSVNDSVSAGYKTLAGYEADVRCNATLCVVGNVSANSANILGKPFNILLWYEQ